MAYTPPAGNAADFTWIDASAYTAPAGDAANLAFVPDVAQAALLGVGLIGTPRITILANYRAWLQIPGLIGVPQAQSEVASAVWLHGAGLLGTPQSDIHVRSVAWMQSMGLMGVPIATAEPRRLAALLAPGLLGAPQAMAEYEGWHARLSGVGLMGIPSAASWAGYRAQLRAPGLLGTPQSRLWGLPAAAVAIPPGVTYYFCKLTGAPDGLPDLTLPISSFSVRHRPDAPSYYQITIPSYAYVSDLAARPNGEIVIWSEQAGVSEELARGDLGQVAIARGPESQSISISGNADRAELPHLTYVIPEALYVASSFSGDTRMRIEPRARIRPGDYVRYQDLNMAVGEVTWAVSVSAGGMAATMELVSAPVENGGEFYALAEARLMGAGLLGSPQVVASREVDENEMLVEFITLQTDGATTTRQVSVTPGTYEVHLLEGDNPGDIDLYVRLGTAPTTSVYDCKSDGLADEYCEVVAETATTLHILLLAYDGPCTNELRVLRQLPPEIEVLPFSHEYSLTQLDPWIYNIAVVAGTYDVTLSAPDGTSGVDAQLWTRFDASPLSNANCKQYNPVAAETCRVTTAAPALLYFMMYPMGAIPVTALITITAVPT